MSAGSVSLVSGGGIALDLQGSHKPADRHTVDVLESGHQGLPLPVCFGGLGGEGKRLFELDQRDSFIPCLVGGGRCVDRPAIRGQTGDDVSA